MKRFRIAGIFIAASLLLLSGCGSKKEEASVYYLNFKPEAAKTWEEIIYDYLNAPEPSDPSENTKNPTPAKRKWDS